MRRDQLKRTSIGLADLQRILIKAHRRIEAETRCDNCAIGWRSSESHHARRVINCKRFRLNAIDGDADAACYGARYRAQCRRTIIQNELKLRSNTVSCSDLLIRRRYYLCRLRSEWVAKPEALKGT